MKQTNTGQWCDKIPDNSSILYDANFDVIKDSWRSDIYTSKTVVLAVSNCWIGRETYLW